MIALYQSVDWFIYRVSAIMFCFLVDGFSIRNRNVGRFQVPRRFPISLCIVFHLDIS